MKIQSCLAAFLLLAGCVNGKQEIDFPNKYSTNVRGLFLTSESEKICRMRLTVNDLPAKAMGDIWKNRNEIDALFVGIDIRSNFEVDFASPLLCDKLGREKTAERLSNILDIISFQQVESYTIQNEEEVFIRLGLNKNDTSNFGSDATKYCKVDREFVKYVDHKNLVDIRYGLAVPIFFYSRLGNREFIIFDESCRFRDFYLKLIDQYALESQ